MKMGQEITVLDQVMLFREEHCRFDSIFSSIASVPPEDVESRGSLTEEDFAYVADKLDVEDVQ